MARLPRGIPGCSYESDLQKVIKAIDAAHIKPLEDAGGYVRGVMVKLVSRRNRGRSSAPGDPPRRVTGDLKKGIKAVLVDGPQMQMRVGLSYPAQHGHLLEFGTPKMRPRPFVRLAFETSADEVKRILSEDWDV